jgi:hypothetical protein
MLWPMLPLAISLPDWLGDALRIGRFAVLLVVALLVLAAHLERKRS